MSRRAMQPPLAAAASALNRMAPGGRLWSESEIRPLWRPVGEAGEPPVSICVALSVVNIEPATPAHPPTIIGSGDVLADGSDSTYVRDTRISTAGEAYDSPMVLTFGAAAVADSFAPASMYFTVRGRRNTNALSCEVILGQDMYDSGAWSPYYGWAGWAADYVGADVVSVPPLSGEWQTWDLRDNMDDAWIDELPTAAAIQDGLIQAQIWMDDYWNLSGTCTIDISEMTLWICSDDSGMLPSTGTKRPPRRRP